jgi:hypothetical protein
MNYPGEEKSRAYYEEAFKVEAKGKIDFYKKEVEVRNRNIKRLTGELDEETMAKRSSETEAAEIEARLSDLAKEAKRLLFKDFRAAVSEVLNGQESQMNGRFGLSIEKQGPYRIEKPVFVSRDGKRVVETRQVSVMKLRNNEEALVKFQDYMRQAGNMPIDGLTFDELKEDIEKFFHDAPRPDSYGEAYEEEKFIEDPVKPLSQDNLFKQFDSFKRSAG